MGSGSIIGSGTLTGSGSITGSGFACSIIYTGGSGSFFSGTGGGISGTSDKQKKGLSL